MPVEKMYTMAVLLGIPNGVKRAKAKKESSRPICRRRVAESTVGLAGLCQNLCDPTSMDPITSVWTLGSGSRVSDRAHLRFCLTLLVRFADVLFNIGET